MEGCLLCTAQQAGASFPRDQRRAKHQVLVQTGATKARIRLDVHCLAALHLRLKAPPLEGANSPKQSLTILRRLVDIR